MNPSQVCDRITSKTIRHFLASGFKDITAGMDGFDVRHDGEVVAEFRTRIVGTAINVTVTISDVVITRTSQLTSETVNEPEGYCDSEAFKIFYECGSFLPATA